MKKHLFLIVTLVTLFQIFNSISSRAQAPAGTKPVLPVQKAIEARKGIPPIMTTAKQVATPQPTPEAQKTGK